MHEPSLSTRALNTALILVVLILPAAAARALETDDPVVDIYLFNAQLSLALYGPEYSQEFRPAALNTLAGIDKRISRVTASMPGEQAAARNSINEHWARIRALTVGDPGAPAGLLGEGYDTNLHWSYVSAMQELIAELEPQTRPSADSELRDELVRKLAAAMSRYVQVATDPMGGYDSSATQDDNNFPKIAAQVDAAFERYRQSTTGAAGANAEALRNAMIKWRFIRTSIVQSGRTSTPWIVYRQGLETIKLIP